MVTCHLMMGLVPRDVTLVDFVIVGTFQGTFTRTERAMTSLANRVLRDTLLYAVCCWLKCRVARDGTLLSKFPEMTAIT